MHEIPCYPAVMHKTLICHLFVIVLLAGVMPADAAPACGSLIMPVADLRSVGRGMSRSHAGIDLMAAYGSPVRAAAAGDIIFASRYYGYGNMVDIRHADGSVTRYAHLSRFATSVRPGTRVTAGQVIGAIGTTGRAHGPHLHFELRINGVPVNPEPAIMGASCPTPPRVPPQLLVEVRPR